MREFSLTLLSNGSVNLYENTLSSFTNLLKSAIVLDENWVVGIRNVFVNKINNVERKKRDIQCEYLHKYNKELSKIKELIEEYFKSLSETGKEDVTIKKKRSDIPDFVEYFERIFHPIEYLTHQYIENSMINMSIGERDIIEHAFIYTDIIQTHHIGNQLSRCLKVFPLTTKENFISFPNVDYFPVQSNILKDISILITNGSGEKINFASSNLPTFCTLHFKKYI